MASTLRRSIPVSAFTMRRRAGGPSWSVASLSCDRLGNGVGNALDEFAAHEGVQRQRDDLLADALGDFEIIGTTVAIERMAMDREEVDSRRDSLGLQSRHHAIAPAVEDSNVVDEG